jgi:hypothetical protein
MDYYGDILGSVDKLDKVRQARFVKYDAVIRGCVKYDTGIRCASR